MGDQKGRTLLQEFPVKLLCPQTSSALMAAVGLTFASPSSAAASKAARDWR